MESMSRYSIVERLTRMKLDIMTASSELNEDLKKREQKVKELKKDLENWKKDVEEDKKREARAIQKGIEGAEISYSNAKERIKEKENAYNAKIKAIDDALKRIETISSLQNIEKDDK